MLHWDVLVFLAGLGLLTAGAEGLVRGGSRLAATLRVSPLVIGLTIASFGTSMPELVVSVIAAWRGDTVLAVGNAVGSNILNILLVLGPAALITPLVVQAAVVRREVPIMIASLLALTAVAWSGTIARWQGALLVLGILWYTWFTYRTSRRETQAVDAQFAQAFDQPEPGRAWKNVGLIVAGVAFLAAGGHFVVEGAVGVATTLGVSDRIIALTLVAGGTSAPEVATTLVAALRKEVDIAVGNIVGSCIFNSLAIIGIASLVAPLEVPAAAWRLEIPAMLLAGIALLPIVGTRGRISRIEGSILTAGFLVYMGLLLSGFGGLPA